MQLGKQILLKRNNFSRPWNNFVTKNKQSGKLIEKLVSRSWRMEAIVAPIKVWLFGAIFTRLSLVGERDNSADNSTDQNKSVQRCFAKQQTSLNSWNETKQELNGQCSIQSHSRKCLRQWVEGKTDGTEGPFLLKFRRKPHRSVFVYLPTMPSIPIGLEVAQQASNQKIIQLWKGLVIALSLCKVWLWFANFANF